MKKYLLIFFLFLAFPKIALASYQTAKNDYTFQYSKYRDAVDRYQVSKSTYLTYRTLTAQNDAILNLRATIQARDSVISAYYNLLQEKLNASPGMSPAYQLTFAGIKNNENAWLAEHQKKIDAAASLEDLNSAAAEFEGHYPQFDQETRQAIGKVLSTKEGLLLSEAETDVATFSAKLLEIRTSGQDTTLLDRGMIFVRNKLDLSQQKYQSAQLSEANQYLREALNYLKELVKSITG